MTWRDNIKPATFRGVAFHVETSELSGGRRGVTHEYAEIDGSYREDLGRKVRDFPVEGYVIGADYFPARDELITALETPGPGELVHPYHGIRRVAVTGFRVRESRDEGGMARFSIEFEETPVTPTFPSSFPNAAQKVRSGAAAARSAASAEFLVKYRVTRAPSFALQSLESTLTSASSAMDSALRPLVSNAQRASSLKQKLGKMSVDAALLVRAPEDLVSRLGDTFDVLDSTDGVAGLLSAYGFESDGERPAATTSTREQEQENYDALIALLRRYLAIQAAEHAPDQTFDSYDAALVTRDAILAALDEQSETADDDAYATLEQLRANLVKAVPAAGLPRLLTYSPPVTLPSLVIAHQLYGDVSRELELVARNSVSNPAFIVGGRPLEILSDE